MTEERRSCAFTTFDGRGADRRRGRVVIVELEGLEIFGRHGVLEDERRDGRNFFYDISLEVSEAALSDRLEDAVDYREVAACVQEVSDGSSSSSSRRSPEPSPTRSSSGSRSNTSASASASRIRGPQASRSRTRPLSPSARGLDRRGRDRELVADRSDPAHGRRRPQVSLDVVVGAAPRRVPDADALPASIRLFRERLQVAPAQAAAFEHVCGSRAPEREVDVGGGRDRDRRHPAAGDPDPVDVALVFAEVEARTQRRP